MPEIEFRYDKGIDATDRVARLLEEEHAGRDADTAAPAGEAGAPGHHASGVDDDADADEEQDDEPTRSS